MLSNIVKLRTALDDEWMIITMPNVCKKWLCVQLTIVVMTRQFFFLQMEYGNVEDGLF